MAVAARKGTNKVYSHEQKELVVNDYLQAHARGETRQAVCDRHKVHISTIIKWVKDQGRGAELGANSPQHQLPSPQTKEVVVGAPELAKRGRPLGSTGKIRTLYNAATKLQVLDALRNRHRTGKSRSQVLREFGITNNNSCVYQWTATEAKLRARVAQERANVDEAAAVALTMPGGNGAGHFIEIDPTQLPPRRRSASGEWSPNDIPEEVHALVGRLMIENVHLKRYGRRH